MKFRLHILSALAIAAIFTFCSCQKSYTCHCNITYGGAPGLPDSTVQTYTITDSKSNASSKCTKESGNYKNNNITTVENCNLY